MRAIRRAVTHVASAACVIAFVAACDRPETHAPVTLRFVEDRTSPRYGSVDAYPIADHMMVLVDHSKPLLAVRVGDSTGLPMIGAYALVGDTLRFQPRFKPMPGATYYAAYNEGDGVLTSRAEWHVPVDSGPPTTSVSAVYPSADVVPMNLLRMYVQFSAPMSTGRVWDFVKLYQGDSLLDEPFYTAGGVVELWDADKTRLTVLFDPGRIKRDLKPNEERGLPLRSGKRYRLVIDKRWPDAAGRPLTREHVKRFHVGAMDRSLVRTSDWRVTTPMRPTDSLVIVFPEALDRALLGRMLVVRDSSGREVGGATTVSARETRWAFAPTEPWRSSAYYVDVNTELEDVAGNNLRKLFDVALGDTNALGANSERVRILFRVR